MTQERFLTVPSSGEAARPFAVLCDEAEAALPPGFPADAPQVLVALDIDGTILTPAGATERVLEGIHGLSAAGAQVVIATGRALEGVTPVLEVLDFTEGWALCNNGATLVRVTGGECEIVEEHTFVPGPVLAEIAGALPEAVFASMPHPDTLLSAPFPNDEIEGTDRRVVSMEELASTPTPKVVVREPDMDRDYFESVLTSLTVARTHEVFVGWTSWADIEPKGVTKASGLEELRVRLDVPGAGTVAVGDGTNDIAMIQWAAFGVAMGGASTEVRSRARHVTAAVENDGAAAVMHALMRRCGVDGALT